MIQNWLLVCMTSKQIYAIIAMQILFSLLGWTNTVDLMRLLICAQNFIIRFVLFLRLGLKCNFYVKMEKNSNRNWNTKKYKMFVVDLRALIFIPQINTFEWIGANDIWTWFIWWAVAFQISCHCCLSPLSTIHCGW